MQSKILWIPKIHQEKKIKKKIKKKEKEDGQNKLLCRMQ